MKSYVLKSPGEIEIIEKEILPLKKNEVLIRVSNIGICGSDIQLFEGTYKGPVRYPLLFGHEWSGTVTEIGENVKKVKPGDKVTGDCSHFCGNCDQCSIDKNLCKNIDKFGITIDGASSEYIIREENYIYKAPQELELELICLTEPIAVAAHLIGKVINSLPVIKNKRILIYGGGPIGISALLILTKLYSCQKVYLTDIINNRSRIAKKLGASIINPENLYYKFDNLDYSSIYNNSTFDFIVESTGNPEVFKNTLNLIRPLGVIGCLGMMNEVTIIQKLIVIKGLKLIGSIGGTGEFPMVLDFIKENQNDVKNLISHKIPIREINKAFTIAKDISQAMKVQLIF